jgi:amino acid transporter
LGVNAIVGSGIFLVPGRLAATLGSWSVMIFLLSGLALGFVALAFARLASMSSRNGGAYSYVQLAFGDRAAFAIGWISWICAVVSTSAVGSGIGFYLSHFTGGVLDPVIGRATAVTFLLALGAINYLGVAHGSRVMVSLTVLKCLPLFALGLGGIAFIARGGGHELFLGAPPSWHQFSLGMVMVLFTCQGFEAVPVIAGETRDPLSTVPRAILFSLAISIALYCILQAGILGGPAVGSTKPLADQAVYLWGTLGGNLVAAAGLVSILGFVAGIALAAPRFLSPLCEDGHLPHALAALHPRYGTPTHAILLTTAASIVCSLVGDVDALIALSALAVALQYLSASLALVTLVARGKAKGWIVGPLSLIVSIFFLWQSPGISWVVIGSVLAVGLGISAGHRRARRSVLSVDSSGRGAMGSLSIAQKTT